jgi:hypothetical protein
VGTYVEAEVEAVLAVVAIHGALGQLGGRCRGDEHHEGEREGDDELHVGSDVLSMSVFQGSIVVFRDQKSRSLCGGPTAIQKIVDRYRVSVSIVDAE